MNIFGIALMLSMVPVIFFGIVVPMWKIGIWISLDVISKGTGETTWYGFMIYMIFSFWGVMFGLAACAGWVYLFTGE